VDETLAAAVRARAGSRCEYCLIPDDRAIRPFEIDHVIPRQHGGPTAPGNLAYTCLNCNKHKGPNLAGIDRVTSRTKLVRLFNPRQHRWGYHFTFDGPRVVGLTPIGRVTVYVLDMNVWWMTDARAALITEGVFPPDG
jgi:hypothetical protein